MTEEQANIEARERFTGPHPGPFDEADLVQHETIPHPRRKYAQQPAEPGLGAHAPDAHEERPHRERYWTEEHPVDARS